jgi:hypothetical protein
METVLIVGESLADCVKMVDSLRAEGSVREEIISFMKKEVVTEKRRYVIATAGDMSMVGSNFDAVCLRYSLLRGERGLRVLKDAETAGGEVMVFDQDLSAMVPFSDFIERSM